MAQTPDLEKTADQSTRMAAAGKGRPVVKWILAAAVLVLAAVMGWRYWDEASRTETTDDAQVDASIYQISSRIPGHVTEVFAEDQKFVQAGDVLVQLDRGDYEVALAKAQADLRDALASLATARNDVPVTSISTSSTLNGAQSLRDDALAAVSTAEQQMAAVEARLPTAEANVRVAEANANKAAQDVEKYKTLIAKDEVSRQVYDQALAALEAARATVDAQKAMVNEVKRNVQVAAKAVDQAKARLAQAEAAVEGAQSGPQQVKVSESRVEAAAARVAQKQAEVKQAELNLSYTTVRAPVTGIVGRKNILPGQNIAAGQPLMAVVDLDDIWVTANFKENQLRNIQIGQAARVEADANGRTYTGKVERISGASGAKFSLLPPENATGNFVKVVQRIPVRIALDPGQDPDHVLRPGMSVTPVVNIR